MFKLLIIFVFKQLNSYVKFSSVAARVVRRCLQEESKKKAMKNEEAYANINKWVDGKMVAPKSKF